MPHDAVGEVVKADEVDRRRLRLERRRLVEPERENLDQWFGARFPDLSDAGDLRCLAAVFEMRECPVADAFADVERSAIAGDRVDVNIELERLSLSEVELVHTAIVTVALVAAVDLVCGSQ